MTQRLGEPCRLGRSVKEIHNIIYDGQRTLHIISVLVIFVTYVGLSGPIPHRGPKLYQKTFDEQAGVGNSFWLGL